MIKQRAILELKSMEDFKPPDNINDKSINETIISRAT